MAFCTQTWATGLMTHLHPEHSVVGRAMAVPMHGSPQGQAQHSSCICWVYHTVVPAPCRCKFWPPLLIISAFGALPLCSMPMSLQESYSDLYRAHLTRVFILQCQMPEKLLSAPVEAHECLELTWQ